jgi:anti-anti-sigma factor
MLAKRLQEARTVDPAALRCVVEVRGAGRIVCVEGEIDPSTIRQLRDAIRDAVEASPERLVIDLAGVTFMDSTALHALIDADHRCRAAALHLVIVPAPERVHHPFRIAGLEGRLPFA